MKTFVTVLMLLSGVVTLFLRLMLAALMTVIFLTFVLPIIIIRYLLVQTGKLTSPKAEEVVGQPSFN